MKCMGVRGATIIGLTVLAGVLVHGAPAASGFSQSIGSASTAAALGVELGDPVVTDVMALFDVGKTAEAIALVDRTVKERIQGDPERNRELRLLGGILGARSDMKLPDVKGRLKAAIGPNDSYGTSAKAELALDALAWALKNGAKGDRPDLKKQEDWLRALDGARESHLKDLKADYDKWDRTVDARSFRGLEAQVKASRRILDRVLVNKHLAEKSGDIRIGYVDKLRAVAADIGRESGIIQREISDLDRERLAPTTTAARSRQLADKIKQKNKQIDDAHDAVAMLNSAIASLPS